MQRITAVISLFLALFSLSAFANDLAKDVPGASDPEGFPRISDSVITGYEHSKHDIGRFYNGHKERSKRYTEAEGKRTRIAYVTPKNVSTVQILRSYQSGFADIGEVSNVFECRPPTQCKLGPVKNDQLKITSVPKHLQWVYYDRNDLDRVYWYGTVAAENALYHVSLYSGIQNDGERNLKRFHGRALIWLDIIEVSKFKPTLEFVTAEVITSKINQNGRVALYGIQFEFDSAKLTNESSREIAEVAKTLQEDKQTSFYVVGHTDNVGSYDYNQKLSEERANTVIKALVERHKIKQERLQSVGVGPVSPLASNDSEDGKTLNRRVELVKK
jgi:outer membrane protein OmpA-like peptidoglycan-associated protein